MSDVEDEDAPVVPPEPEPMVKVSAVQKRDVPCEFMWQVLGPFDRLDWMLGESVQLELEKPAPPPKPEPEPLPEGEEPPAEGEEPPPEPEPEAPEPQEGEEGFVPLAKRVGILRKYNPTGEPGQGVVQEQTAFDEEARKREFKVLVQANADIVGMKVSVSVEPREEDDQKSVITYFTSFDLAEDAKISPEEAFDLYWNLSQHILDKATSAARALMPPPEGGEEEEEEEDDE